MPERVYLDASPVIFLIEQVPLLGPAVDQRITRPDVVSVASTLTRMECRVKPLRNGDSTLLREYEQFFSASVGELISLADTVFDRAAEIRAGYPFKTPDAIHLAAAMLSGCDVVLTHDRRLLQFPDITVELIQP